MDAGFGVYVHWPFCASKCPYCDFNSHVRAAGIDEPRFLAAYLRELRHWAELVPGKARPDLRDHDEGGDEAETEHGVAGQQQRQPGLAGRHVR